MGVAPVAHNGISTYRPHRCSVKFGSFFPLGRINTTSVNGGAVMCGMRIKNGDNMEIRRTLVPDMGLCFDVHIHPQVRASFAGV
jgi:hypothetical protein